MRGREPAPVILTGKRDSRRHVTTSLSQNVKVVAKTSYEMLEVLSFSDRENA